MTCNDWLSRSTTIIGSDGKTYSVSKYQGVYFVDFGDFIFNATLSLDGVLTFDGNEFGEDNDWRVPVNFEELMGKAIDHFGIQNIKKIKEVIYPKTIDYRIYETALNKVFSADAAAFRTSVGHFALKSGFNFVIISEPNSFGAIQFYFTKTKPSEVRFGRGTE